MIGASEDEIRRCEEQLGWSLPESLRNLFSMGRESAGTLAFEFDGGVALVASFLSLRGRRGGSAMGTYRDVIIARGLNRKWFPFAYDPVGNTLIVDCESAEMDVWLVLGGVGVEDVVPLGAGFLSFMLGLAKPAIPDEWLQAAPLDVAAASSQSPVADEADSSEVEGTKQPPKGD